MKIVVLIGIAILITYGITRWMHGQDVIISREYPEEKIDSVTTVYQNRIETKDNIIDSIRARNSNLADRIEKQGNKIAAFTSVEGQLRTKIDSLQQTVQRHNIAGLLSPDTLKILKDTTLKKTRTFGDSLFSVYGTVNIKQDSLWQQLALQQLRPIDIDVAVTVSEDRRSVRTYLSSKDFVRFAQTQATTQIKPEEQFPWHWVTAAGGLVAGILIAK